MSKLEKNVVFCRKRKASGIYTGNVSGQVIRLVDRATYVAKDPVIAAFLLADPEIEIFCANEDEQKEENARNFDKEKNLPGRVIHPK